jgi:acetyl esterase/lipase
MIYNVKAGRGEGRYDGEHRDDRLARDREPEHDRDTALPDGPESRLMVDRNRYPHGENSRGPRRPGRGTLRGVSSGHELHKGHTNDGYAPFAPSAADAQRDDIDRRWYLMTSYDDLTTGLVDFTAPSRQARAIAGVLRLGWRPVIDRLDGRFVVLSLWRAALDTGTRLLRPDPGVRIQRIKEMRVSGAVPVAGEWVRPRDEEQGAVLYLHGGGYAFGSPRTHRMITSRLAVNTGLPVLAPRYRLAPEHPFPAAFDDGIAAYRWLLAQGLPPSRIVVAGDSSGGHLAAAVVREACRSGLPSPAGVVLFSPWVDLTCELSGEIDQECRDPFISPALARHFGRMYVGDHDDWSDPRLALLDCDGLELPPFLIQVAEKEALRAEAERLAEALTATGNSCELQVWPGQIHAFQILSRVFPEARAALREAADFIQNAVGLPATGQAA